MRIRRRFTLLFLALQLGAVAAIGAVPAYWLLRGVDGKPAVGALLAAAAAAIAVVLTLARLTRINA